MFDDKKTEILCEQGYILFQHFWVGNEEEVSSWSYVTKKIPPGGLLLRSSHGRGNSANTRCEVIKDCASSQRQVQCWSPRAIQLNSDVLSCSRVSHMCYRELKSIDGCWGDRNDLFYPNIIVWLFLYLIMTFLMTFQRVFYYLTQ